MFHENARLSAFLFVEASRRRNQLSTWKRAKSNKVFLDRFVRASQVIIGMLSITV